MPRPKVKFSRNHARDIAGALKRERPDLDPDDYLYLLYAQRVGRILDAVDNKHCREEYGVSGADMRVLFALRRAGPPYALRPTELFRSLLVTSGAITKQVDRLAAEGYVDRLPGPANSGGSLIHLTDKGFKAADDALTSLVNSSVLSINALTRRERTTILGLLEKMLVDLEGRLVGDEDAPRRPAGKAVRAQPPNHGETRARAAKRLGSSEPAATSKSRPAGSKA